MPLIILRKEIYITRFAKIFAYQNKIVYGTSSDTSASKIK